MTSVKGITDNFSVVTPRLFCRDVAAEIEFCKSTFGAVELNRRPAPDGTAAHALMTIGSAMIMIEAEWPQVASRAPQPDGSSPVVIYVYVEDVDKTMACLDRRHAHRRDYRRGEREPFVPPPRRFRSP